MNKEDKIKELFSKGFGIVALVCENGLYEYHHNKQFSQKERKILPVYREEMPENLINANKLKEENRIKAELENEINNPILSFIDVAKKVNRKLKGRLIYKSKSGSIYSEIKGKKIRFSDHLVKSMNPEKDSAKTADFEIIAENRHRCFRQNDINLIVSDIENFLNNA